MGAALACNLTIRSPSIECDAAISDPYSPIVFAMGWVVFGLAKITSVRVGLVL